MKNKFTFTQDLERSHPVQLQECYIDESFSAVKKGAGVGKTKRGKGSKVMAIADAKGYPISVPATSATLHEVKLVLLTLEARTTLAPQPCRLISDKAYDSDVLDQQCKEIGVELIALHKANRRKAVIKDGRSLRCYQGRWKIERLFAWLHNFRKLINRFDYKIEDFQAFGGARRFYDFNEEVFVKELLIK